MIVIALQNDKEKATNVIKSIRVNSFFCPILLPYSADGDAKLLFDLLTYLAPTVLTGKLSALLYWKRHCEVYQN